ncbi:hypothetical protein NPX88_15300 [Bacillus mycoides]|nr:hypothetical protein [Bacillus mycoides]
MVKKSKTKRNFRLSMEELDVLGELEAAEEYIESWEEAFELFHKAGIALYRQLLSKGRVHSKVF